MCKNFINRLTGRDEQLEQALLMSPQLSLNKIEQLEDSIFKLKCAVWVSKYAGLDESIQLECRTLLHKQVRLLEEVNWVKLSPKLIPDLAKGVQSMQSLLMRIFTGSDSRIRTMKAKLRLTYAFHYLVQNYQEETKLILGKIRTADNDKLALEHFKKEAKEEVDTVAFRVHEAEEIVMMVEEAIRRHIEKNGGVSHHHWKIDTKKLAITAIDLSMEAAKNQDLRNIARPKGCYSDDCSKYELMASLQVANNNFHWEKTRLIDTIDINEFVSTSQLPIDELLTELFSMEYLGEPFSSFENDEREMWARKYLPTEEVIQMGITDAWMLSSPPSLKLALDDKAHKDKKSPLSLTSQPEKVHSGNSGRTRVPSLLDKPKHDEVKSDENIKKLS